MDDRGHPCGVSYWPLKSRRRTSVCAANVISVADNHRRGDQYQQAQHDEEHCSGTGALPFFQSNTPQGAEDDDAGHMQCPTGELKAAHLRFPHGVKEKLHVPRGSR
jgi:hypothetical protein